MICNQAVKQVHIVLAESAEVEEFVNCCLLQAKLSETYGLVSTPAVSTNTNTIIHTPCFLDLVAFCTGRSQTVGAEVLADVGRVGGVIVLFTNRQGIALAASSSV